MKEEIKFGVVMLVLIAFLSFWGYLVKPWTTIMVSKLQDWWSSTPKQTILANPNSPVTKIPTPSADGLMNTPTPVAAEPSSDKRSEQNVEIVATEPPQPSPTSVSLDAKAYYKRGLAYWNNGEYDRAIEEYTQAITLNSQYAEAYNNRGIIYKKKEEYDRAIADYTQAITLNSKYAKAYNNRGLAYADQGEYDRAIADYTQALTLNPEYAKAYNSRGLAYEHTGQRDDAVADFKKACELGVESACNVKEAEKHTQRFSEATVQAADKNVLYVYDETKNPQYGWHPSGRMPDGGGVAFTDQYSENCHSGETCIKNGFDARKKAWVGIYWLPEPGKWKGPGINIYEKLHVNEGTPVKLTFWARGEKGGERVKFKVGGVRDGNDSVPLPIETEWIPLEKEWTQYAIDLSGHDLRNLVGGFCWVTEKKYNPEQQNVLFYLDDIRYEQRTEDEEWMTIAKKAIDTCNYNGLRSLLTERKIVSVNPKDEMGRTLLHYASKQNCFTIVIYLIKKSAIINVQDYEGAIPLHFAAQYADAFVVHYLIQPMADIYLQTGINIINIKDNHGETPLDWIVKKRGADSNKKTIITLLEGLHGLGVAIPVNLIARKDCFEGWVCNDLGLYEDAIESLSEAISYDETGTCETGMPGIAYEFRGIAYYSKKLYNQAIPDFSQAIRFNPNEPRLYYNRGTAYADQGDCQNALPDFNRCISLILESLKKPDDPLPELFLRALAKKEQCDENAKEQH